MNIDIKDIIDIAIGAGDEILKVYYGKKGIGKEIKSDNSPVTEADKVADKYIREELTKLYPEIPIISEETPIPDYSIRSKWEYLWIVDPLDGTKDFISRSGEFSVNIALIKKHKPILGVIFAPAFNKTYYAESGKGAYLLKENVTKKLPIVTEKDYYSTFISKNDGMDKTKEWIKSLNLNKKLLVKRLGSSLKGCEIAEGKSDFYLKMSHIMEWDTAAMQVIIEESGKRIVDFQTKKPLIYNKKTLKNPLYLID